MNARIRPVYIPDFLTGHLKAIYFHISTTPEIFLDRLEEAAREIWWRDFEKGYTTDGASYCLYLGEPKRKGTSRRGRVRLEITGWTGSRSIPNRSDNELKLLGQVIIIEAVTFEPGEIDVKAICCHALAHKPFEELARWIERVWHSTDPQPETEARVGPGGRPVDDFYERAYARLKQDPGFYNYLRVSQSPSYEETFQEWLELSTGSKKVHWKDVAAFRAKFYKAMKRERLKEL